MKKHILTLACLCLGFIGLSQKSLQALRINQDIKIDGHLNEAVWSKAEIASDFTNWQPEAGTKPTFKTEVKIIYDDDAIYMGAIMHTDSRDDIQTQLTARDQVGNTDFVGIIIDTYGNGTQGFEFLLCATGVQFDANVDESSGENSDWSEVWYSDVKITDNGWTAEIRIPYSAIRFPSQEIQDWRINILRSIPSTGEKCSFQFIDPEIQGFVNQTAFLKGVTNIKAPIRLSLSPYITGYIQQNKMPGADPENSTSYSYNGGLDLKYGINDAFTLDMTLIPDFGQVQSDDQVLNLSPFEVRFAENRQFFTEGVDLFTKADLFYSRRVGGVPLHYWNIQHNLKEGHRIINNPGETQLYNATKISGRTSNGLGIGVFNAISGKTEAQIENLSSGEISNQTTSPLTNYNVTVLDQNLANNSHISLTNTNVFRRGKDFYDANVTGTTFNLRTKNQKWGVSGNGAISTILNADDDNVVGGNYSLSAGKISGVFNYEFQTDGTSPDYSINDLGYNTTTDVKSYSAYAGFNRNTAWKGFANGSIWFNATYGTTYTTNAYRYVHFNSGVWAKLKNLWTINMWTNFRPENHDYFEPRVQNRYLRRAGTYNMGWYVGTDNRKKLRIGLYVFGIKRFREGANVKEISIDPRYRFNDKLSMYISTGFYQQNRDLGWVSFINNEPIMGIRDRNTVINLIGIDYSFNHIMSLETRVRHYWSKVIYDSFHGIDNQGGLIETDYNEANDFSFNSFNIDMNFRWRFAPGSDIILNWKNAIYGGLGGEDVDFNKRTYKDGLSSLSNLPQTNSISLRIVYFLNAQDLL